MILVVLCLKIEVFYKWMLCKTAVEIIREDAFGGAYFRDIYSSIAGKWYEKSRREFDQLKGIDQKFYFSDYYDASVNKC